MVTSQLSIVRQEIGVVQGQTIYTYVLRSGDIEIKLTNIGATIMSISVPDRNGVSENIIAGLKTAMEYWEQDHPYLGSTVGRFANRIANGKFNIDGKSYQLTVNNPPHHLHGGHSGFHKKIWNVQNCTENQHQCSVEFSLKSPDGEEGYPGNLTAFVKFTLTRFNELRLQFRCCSDRATPVNPTSHPYFNLSGFKDPNIFNHNLKINSSFYTEAGRDNIPTGKVQFCADTPYDFTRVKPLGRDILLLSADGGYDQNFLIDGEGLRNVATLTHSDSGRKLSIYSDRPALQVYTANFWTCIDGAHKNPYGRHAAVALETQNCPDAPNHNNFPNSILQPREVFYSTTVYKFELL